jgi:RecB family exonuclease
MADLILSGSSLAKYRECRLRWWFTYVAQEPGGTSWERVIGQSVHSAIEGSLRRIMQLRPFHTPAAENIVAESDADLDAAFGRESAVTIAHGRLGATESRAMAHRALAAYWRAFPPSAVPWLVEEPFEVEIDGIPYSGTIDRVDRDETVRLRDTKTTGSRPPGGRYDLTMTGYWLGLSGKHAVRADEVVLDWIVQTKTPYVWNEWIEIDDAAIERFVFALRYAAESIAEGHFEPTGLDHPWACRTCEYRDICGPYQRVNGGMA